MKPLSDHFVRDLFDRLAPHYDVLNRSLSLGIDVHWRHLLTRDLPVHDGNLILDVCTGTADVALTAVERYHRPRIIGVDVSAEMLKRGRIKVRAKKRSDLIDLIRADGLRLPFADNSFDGVLNAFGLRNQGDYPRALNEMQRVLKPAGILRIMEFAPTSSHVLTGAYRFYLSRVMPWAARLMTGAREPHDYLAQSVESFLPPAEMTALLQSCSFKRIETKRLWGGIAYIYSGVTS